MNAKITRTLYRLGTEYGQENGIMYHIGFCVGEAKMTERVAAAGKKLYNVPKCLFFVLLGFVALGRRLALVFTHPYRCS